MTPDQYIAATPEPKRSDLTRLDALIRRTVPSFEAFMAGNMIGYGKYHYRYESGREGDSCRVGLAGNKSGISLYVTCVDEGGWLAEQWKHRLGKADVGKSCIRFKRLSDLDLDALTNVLRIARTLPAPGEVSSSTTAATKKTGAKKAATKKAAAKKPARAVSTTKKTAAKKPARAVSMSKKAATTTKKVASTKAQGTKKAASKGRAASSSRTRSTR